MPIRWWCCRPSPRLRQEALLFADAEQWARTESRLPDIASLLTDYGGAPRAQKAVTLFATLDERFAAALANGHIKLVSSAFIKRSDHMIQRRQDLEALESTGVTVFLKEEEAVAALHANIRAIGALTCTVLLSNARRPHTAASYEAPAS